MCVLKIEIANLSPGWFIEYLYLMNFIFYLKERGE